MTESAIVLFIFFSICIPCSIIAHFFIRSHLIATFCGSLVASTGFQIANYIHLGHLDAYFAIAFVISFIPAFFISLLTGIVFMRYRHKRENARPNQSLE